MNDIRWTRGGHRGEGLNCRNNWIIHLSTLLQFWTLDVSVIETTHLDRYETHFQVCYRGRGDNSEQSSLSLTTSLKLFITQMHDRGFSLIGPPLRCTLSKFITYIFEYWLLPHLASTHVMNAPRPTPFFASLPFPCIIVNANRRSLGTRLVIPWL